METLAGLRPAFEKDGTVTAGSAAGINDGGATVVLARVPVAGERGLTGALRTLQGVRSEATAIVCLDPHPPPAQDASGPGVETQGRATVDGRALGPEHRRVLDFGRAPRRTTKGESTQWSRQ